MAKTPNPVPFALTPQAIADSMQVLKTSGAWKTVSLNVMGNDLAGNGKSLYSVDDGKVGTVESPNDLLTKDTAYAANLDSPASTDRSFLGAKIWVKADGTVGYDARTIPVSKLPADGTSVTDYFIYAIRMGDGTLSWAKASIVLGNSGPTVGAVSANVNEDGPKSSLAALANSTDDFTTNLAVVVTSSLPDWVKYDATTKTFTLDPAHAHFQSLNAGVTETVTVNYTVSDGIAAPVGTTATWVVTGVNDAAVIGSASATGVTEDQDVVAGALAVSGTISVSDVDKNESAFQTAVTSDAGNLGSLSLAADGSYTFSVANADVQYLGAGDSKTEKFTVSSLDGTSKDVSFTINGVNDAANIGAIGDSDVTEDANVVAGQLGVSGTISISDADADEGSFQTTVDSATGNLGSLTMGTDGAYAYSVSNSAVQYLGEGVTQTDKFTIYALDGTSKEVSFTIHGVNDAAVIGSPSPASVTEDDSVDGDGNLTASGTLSVSDADQDESSFQTTVTSDPGNLGSLTLAANGDYAYSVANSDVQYLGAGQSRTEKFTVASADGTSKEVTFTINGVNDIATMGGTYKGTVIEDTQLTATGKLTVSDADAGENGFGTVGTLGATFGDFVFNSANGNWTYTLRNSEANVQALNTSDSMTDTLKVESADGSTYTLIEITVQGLDEPVVVAVKTTYQVNHGGNESDHQTIAKFDGDDILKMDGKITYANLFEVGDYNNDGKMDTKVYFIDNGGNKTEQFDVTLLGYTGFDPATQII